MRYNLSELIRQHNQSPNSTGPNPGAYNPISDMWAKVKSVYYKPKPVTPMAQTQGNLGSVAKVDPYMVKAKQSTMSNTLPVEVVAEALRQKDQNAGYYDEKNDIWVTAKQAVAMNQSPNSTGGAGGYYDEKNDIYVNKPRAYPNAGYLQESEPYPNARRLQESRPYPNSTSGNAMYELTRSGI